MRVKVIAQRWAESRPQHVPDAEINWHPGSALGRQAAPAQALAMRLSTLSTLGPFLLPASSAHSLIQQAFADTDPARPVQLQPPRPRRSAEAASWALASDTGVSPGPPSKLQLQGQLQIFRVDGVWRHPARAGGDCAES